MADARASAGPHILASLLAHRPDMKTPLLLALALAAAMLGQRLSQPAPPAPALGETAAPPAHHRAPQPPAEGFLLVSDGGAAARHPAPARLEPELARERPMASALTHPPASAAEQPGTPASSTALPPDSTDWRDTALDLLSQIGVLCPAAGCDSLEDD